MASTRRPILRRLLVFLIASALALLATELYLGRAFPVGSRIYRLHPELLHELIPGARNLLIMDETAGGDHVPIRINAAGMRGALPRAAKDLPRVVVYGDSFVLAENVELEHTFVERLAVHAAEQLSQAVEVLNAGVTGYGPDQALLKFQREAVELDPDLLLLVLCATNDFGDLVRNKLFRLDQSGELQRNAPELAPEVIAEFAAKEEQAERFAIMRTFDYFMQARRLRVGRESRRQAQQQAPPYMQWYLDAARGEYQEFVVRGNNTAHTLFHDYYDADVAIHPDWESALYKRRAMAALLHAWRAACAERELPLLVVIVPSAVDVDPTFRIRVDPQRYPGYEPRRLSQSLADMLAECGVPHVDLYELYAANRPEELFEGFEDVHWNERGQDLAAREIGAHPLLRSALTD